MLPSFIRCLPFKGRGITLSALMTQKANFPAFSPHYPFNALCQLGKLWIPTSLVLWSYSMRKLNPTTTDYGQIHYPLDAT